MKPVGVALCSILILGAIFSGRGYADDPVTEPVKVGTIPRYPDEIAKKYKIGDWLNQTDQQAPQGSLISNPDVGVAYQIWTISNHDTLSDHTIIAERSLETLKITRSIVLDREIIRANSSLGAEYVHTIDTRNQRIFFEYGHYGAVNSEPFGLIVLDTKSFSVREKSFPRGFVRNTEESQSLFGLEYDEEADQLVVLAVGVRYNPSFLANAVSLVGWTNDQIIADGPLPGAPAMLGPRYIRNCRRDAINITTSPRLTPIMIAKGPDLDSPALDPPEKTWYVFPCYSTAYSVNDVLIRISRDGVFAPGGTEEKVIPAPAAIAHWTMDVKRGRMFLLNSTQEIDAWVYEVASNAFIGIIEMSPKGETGAAGVSLGMDERSGRLYAYSAGFGIMITEADQDPVPQADVYDAGGPRVSGQANIAVDPERDRIMLLRGYGTTSWLDHYEIWQVPPPLPQQAREDRDLLTRQVAEQAGKTTAEYGGVASGYGARVLMAGGLAGAVPSNGNETVGGIYGNANTRCGFHDREIAVGVVAKTELSESIVDANAESLRLDDNSIKDFGQPSRCDLSYTYAGPAPQIFPQALRDNIFFASLFTKTESLRRDAGVDEQMAALGVYDSIEELAGVDLDRSSEDHFNGATAPQTTWHYEPAFCAADYYPNDKPGQNSERFAGDTFVECRKANTVSGHAEGHLTAVVGEHGNAIPLKIGRATSTTRVWLDPIFGLTSEATSRVENVQIGELSIGYIENRAKSYAKGRSGTAKTDEYDPVIALVRNSDTVICASKCNLDDVMPQLNNALGGRAEIRRTNPDRALQRGTPGGYEAGIIKSTKQVASDNALTGDDSRQVPALEIMVYNDNPAIGRARQLIQFAGVRATSNYGIKVIDEGSPFEPTDPIAPAPQDPAGPTIITVEKPIPGKTIVKRVPVLVGIPGGYRMLLANPRAAAAMATVWLLLASPAIVWSRRRRLASLS